MFIKLDLVLSIGSTLSVKQGISILFEQNNENLEIFVSSLVLKEPEHSKTANDLHKNNEHLPFTFAVGKVDGFFL